MNNLGSCDQPTEPGVGNNENTDSNGEEDTSGQPDAFIEAPVRTEDEDDVSIDFGFKKNLELGDYVWCDSDRDGIQDSGEPGLEGVVVELYEGTVKVGETTTDANGEYIFNDDTTTSGVQEFTTYTIKIQGTTANMNQLGICRTITDPFQGNNGVDSNGTPDNSNFIQFPFVTADVTTTNVEDYSIDFGFKIPLGIGDFIWCDEDRDGIQDPGEPGIEGVRIQIYLAADNTQIGETVTNSQGFYFFTDTNTNTGILDNTNYAIRIDYTAENLQALGDCDPP
jgi:hypothetical protein